MHTENPQEQCLQVRHQRSVWIPEIAVQYPALQHFDRYVHLASTIDLEIAPSTPGVNGQKDENCRNRGSRDKVFVGVAGALTDDRAGIFDASLGDSGIENGRTGMKW